MRIAAALMGLALVMAPACKKDKGAGEGAATVGSGSDTTSGSTTGSAESATGSAQAASGSGAGSGSDATAGSAAAGSGSDAGSAAGSGAGAGSAGEQMTKRGGNCPSTVFGSTTKAELKDGKILVAITATDKDAVAAIQKRSQELVKEKTDGGAASSAHDQKGSHGGGMGLCPVHLGDGGTAAVKTQKDGVVVTITPKDKPELLKQEIDARITKAAEWVKANIKEGDHGTQGGVGGGKGEHGMNHSGDGDGKGKDDPPTGDGKGGGKGTGGGGGAGTGGGGGKGTGGGGGAGTGGGSGAK